MQRASKKSLAWAGVALFFMSITLFGLPYLLRTTYSEPLASVVASATTTTLQIAHVSTPAAVKAIYMTACVASTPSWRSQLEQLIDTTELNSVVIDIKDYTGTVSFESPNVSMTGATGCRVKDMQSFIAELHSHNIYVIGRITVFQDPYYAKLHPELAIKSKSTGNVWKDKSGLPFIDVGAEPYWDYIVKIAEDAHDIGFDEANFDYVRYPSDGSLSDMNTTWTVGTSTKAMMVKDFFSYLHNKLQGSGLKTSADLFGLTTLAEDDMGIGQVLENALPYFDYVDPMVYPSHFAAGADGYSSPAAHPYDIIDYSMASGIKKEQALDLTLGLATSTPSKLRPWIQDFNLLGVPYGVPEVQAQIKATYDVGLDSWLVWDAGNKYTPGAFQPQS